MDLGSESRNLLEACRSPSELERVAAYERLGGILQRMLWPRVASDPRLQHLAADSAQEAIVKVWKALEADRGPQNPERFIAWSGRIAVNALTDAIRKLEPSGQVGRSKRVALSRQLRLETASTEEGQSLAERLEDPNAAEPEAGLDHAALHALLQEIRRVGRVSERSRTVLLQGFLAERDDDELAEALETSRRNVHVIRCRDLAKLRKDEGFMQRLRQFIGGGEPS